MIPFFKQKRRTFHYRYILGYKFDNTWIEKSKEGLRKTCQHPSTQEKGTGKDTCSSHSDRDPFWVTFSQLLHPF